jgi:hypothetical protein
MVQARKPDDRPRRERTQPNSQYPADTMLAILETLWEIQDFLDPPPVDADEPDEPPVPAPAPTRSRERGRNE